MNNINNNIRLIAEFEPQSSVQLVWPSKDNSPWSEYFPEIEEFYTKLKNIIEKYQDVTVIHQPTNDTWARDICGISVEQDDKSAIANCQFNGWGDKFPHDLDDKLTESLYKDGIYGNKKIFNIPFILEGGSIDSNGQGLVLTTESCLLNPNRTSNTRLEIEQKLATYLGVKKTLWLEYGRLEGDDTDGHIDNLARFADHETILYLKSYDELDPLHMELDYMEQQLIDIAVDNNLTLVPLPLPPAVYSRYEDDKRLPASYLNFLIINGAVIFPTFDVKSDKIAENTLKDAFPGRDIIGIDSRITIEQGGSIHCLTMQVAK